MTSPTPPRWIPPGGLIFAQASHACSWILALWIGFHPVFAAPDLAAIAWIHVVALGWFTVAAFSILLHAIPSFTDAAWRFGRTARVALFAFAAAIAAFAIALLAAPSAAGAAASAIAAAAAVYLVTAWITLGGAVRSADRTDRAVGRAFIVVLGIFAIVVTLGVLLAWMIAGARVPAWFAQLPRAHADLALFGWLTLLIYGVSARTLRPITGNRSRLPVLHVVYGSATAIGAPVLAAGTALPNTALVLAGAALVVVGVGCYVADAIDIMLRATVPHRQPQAFVCAGLFWLVLSVFAGAGVLAGAPWQMLFGYLLLGGWVAQMVNAHTLHIGTRLISTVYRGEDDETRPEELLDGRTTWLTFVLMQAAVGAIGAGLLLRAPAFCVAGAAIGIGGWLTMMAAMAGARSAARTAPISLMTR